MGGVGWGGGGGGGGERDTFNNESNQNNVAGNWLSEEMLLYKKTPVSFQRN